MSAKEVNGIELTLTFDDMGLNDDAIHELFERKDPEALKNFGGIEAMVSRFRTDIHNGVTSDTLQSRRERFGWNKLPEPDPVSFLELVWEACQDRMVQVLLLASVVSIVLGMTIADPHTGEVEYTTGWIEGTAIVISVSVVILVGAGNNYQKAKKFEELARQQAKKEVQVIREGEKRTIDSTEVVCGDILIIEGGIQMCVDAFLIDGQDVKANESAMTGETDPLKKSAANDCFLISGTDIDDGAGIALVAAVGILSEQGRLSDGDKDLEETPLQQKLSEMADDIGKAGLAIALLLFVCLTIKEVVFILRDGQTANAASFLRFLIVAVALVVVCIPEGLPLAVTIALAFGMKAMTQEKCMVRVLASCETMGAATAICTDKTGTLTTNVMTVVQGHLFEEDFLIDGYQLRPRGEKVTIVRRDNPRLNTKKDLLELICVALSLNSNADEQYVDNQLKWVGNKTEIGLLGFVSRFGYQYKDIRKAAAGNFRQYAFNSEKKRMTTVVKESSGNLTLYCKGASEIMVENCGQYIPAGGGDPVPLTEVKKCELTGIIEDMASQGNRTIGVAYFPMPGISDFPTDEPQESQMIFLGIMGIQDPIREEVPNAVAISNRAGITVRMVTGDNLLTAIAIGKKCGIYTDNGWDLAMTGPEFIKMHDENRIELLERLPRLRVLARSSPNDKKVLVGMLQELGDVVGVTGDGTNDSKALKMSNIGFAMNTGTDIAKGSAHMILMDDNFASVVTAIRWGRAVNDNIGKFLQFQLTVNFAGCLITFIGALGSEHNEEPLKPVQLLWLNLIMDTLAALALATERPDDRSLLRHPVFLQAPLISRKMLKFVVVHGSVQLAIMITLIWVGHEWFDCTSSEAQCKKDGGTYESGGFCRNGVKHITVIFNSFIWLQIINELNARKLFQGEYNPFEGLWTRSRPAILILFIIAAFQIFAVEGAGSFMSTTPLNWAQWLGCLAVGFVEVPLGVIERFLPISEYVPQEIIDRRNKENHMRAKLGLAHRGNSIGAPAEQIDDKKVFVDPALPKHSRSRGSSLSGTPHQHSLTPGKNPSQKN